MTSQVDVVFCIELWYSTESWIGIRQHGIYRYILWSICIHLSCLAQLVWSKLKDNKQKLCWPSSWCWFWSIWTSKNPDVLLANIWQQHMLELKSPSLLPLRITWDYSCVLVPSCCITKKHIWRVGRVNASAWELRPSGAKNWSSTRFLSFCPCIKDLLHNADLLFLASGIKLHLLGWFVLKKIQSTYHNVSYRYLYIFFERISTNQLSPALQGCEVISQLAMICVPWCD